MKFQNTTSHTAGEEASVLRIIPAFIVKKVPIRTNKPVDVTEVKSFDSIIFLAFDGFMILTASTHRI